MLYYLFIEADTHVEKNWKAFKGFSQPFQHWIRQSSVRTKPVLSRFNVIYRPSRQTCMFNGGASKS